MGALLSKCKCSTTTDSDPVPETLEQGNATEEKELETLEQGNTTEEKELELPISQKLKNEKLEADKYSNTLAETLNNFRSQDHCVDFKITVSGKDFPSHKNVLAASCKFFRDLFKVSKAADCYELTNVEPSAVEDVLNFLYTGKCRLHGHKHAESALRVANILAIRDLQLALERYLTVAKDKPENIHSEEEFFACREESILGMLMEFWTEGLFCDLTLTTNCGRIVPVHKNVLASVSCYFQGLLRSDMKEVHENNVDFGMVDEMVVNELLNFIYSGKISITFDNVRSLLQASDYLLIEHLKTIIVAFLKASITVLNFWHIFDLVKSFTCMNEMNADILQFICSHYWEITQSDEFLKFAEEDMKCFLSNDDIVCSETQMLESLIRWYKYSKHQRAESFTRLLCLVHISCVPDLYLKFLAEREDIEVLNSYSGHKLRAKVSLDDLKRTSHFYNLVMFGVSGSSPNVGQKLFYWLPFAGPWSYIDQNTSVESTTPLVYAGNALYLQSYHNCQLIYYSNPLSAKHYKDYSCSTSYTPKEFTSSAPLHCAAAVLGNCVYVMGGNKDEPTSTVWRFNFENQTWESVSSMQERRYKHFAISYKDRCIYVFGGSERGFGSYKSTVERYDPQEDSWSYVASMYERRGSGLACVLVDKIYVMGGDLEHYRLGSYYDCEVYDPVIDVWQIPCFSMKYFGTLKSCKDTGTFNTSMGETWDSFDTKGPDPFELKVCMPQDIDLFDESGHIYSPSVTCCNGFIVVFGFDSLRNKKNLRLPFYFVDPETGHFRILYSLPSWPVDASHGILAPLNRRDMIKALEDYSGNMY